MGVLVASRPADHMTDESLDVAKEDQAPREEQHGRHAGSDKLDGRTIEPLADLDGCDGEADVREDLCVPVEMEVVVWDTVDHSDEGHDEEPEGEHPEEDSHDEGHNGEKVRDEGLVGNTLELCVAVEHLSDLHVLSHVDESERCEGRWADGDEHGWAREVGWNTGCEETSEVKRVHEKCHEETEALI